MKGLSVSEAAFRAFPLILILAILGCDGSGGSSGTVLGTIAGPTTATSSGGGSAAINGFGAAQKVAMTADAAFISGSISSAGQADAYDIGAIEPGDRIVVDVANSGGLDAAAALFDGNESLIALNDNRHGGSAGKAPLLNVVARRATDRALVVVTTSVRDGSSGDYTANISIERAAEEVTPRPQVFVMEFDGAVGARAGGRGPMDIPPFDAASIDPRYAGETEQMIDAILRFVRQDYAGLNVEFYRSGDPDIPDHDTTSLYFGLYDPALLGLADYVDGQNANLNQAAIIYTDTFDLFVPFNPSVEQMAQTIANVASHEAGHLLGLNHTEDVKGLMDITASAYELMQDETFRRSKLERNVFRVGAQDGYTSLLDTVGATSTAKFLAAALVVPADPVEPLDPDDPLMTIQVPKCHFAQCLDGDCDGGQESE